MVGAGLGGAGFGRLQDIFQGFVMAITRRTFLAGTSTVALGLGLPGVFRRMAQAAPNSDLPGGGQTVLVVVELTGGNDG
jgi:hypothetical protein